ncbi:hypothetical protein ABZX72_02580 [Streptomyces cyaneofuscatus]
MNTVTGTCPQPAARSPQPAVGLRRGIQGCWSSPGCATGRW